MPGVSNGSRRIIGKSSKMKVRVRIAKILTCIEAVFSIFLKVIAGPFIPLTVTRNLWFIRPVYHVIGDTAM